MALNFDDYFEDVPEGAGKGSESQAPREEAKAVRPAREYDDDYIEPGTRRRKRRYFKYGLIAASVVAVVVAVYLLFFSKRASGGMVKGYLLSIERQEGVFDSYECSLVMDCPDEEKWAESMLFPLLNYESECRLSPASGNARRQSCRCPLRPLPFCNAVARSYGSGCGQCRLCSPYAAFAVGPSGEGRQEGEGLSRYRIA